MLNWFKHKTQITPNSRQPQEIGDSNPEIRLIGDRSSGKTAYMASLAYFPNAAPDSPVQSVTPCGDQEASAELINFARNILEDGRELPPTDLNAVATDVKDYGLTIVLKNKYSLVKLNINCKDYAGEFFSDLIQKDGDSKLHDYLEDCLLATGILLLIDRTSHRKDSEYANALDRFLLALNSTDFNTKKRRIAFTINKCEQPDLWVNRHDPKALAQRRFPRTQKRLEAWENIGAGKVEYFVTSAFGVLGKNYPEPNAVKLSRDRQGTTSVIREPKRWRPFGLVAPIYWLCTGKRHQELDQD